MIHHISLPAQNPPHVAQVLAELFNGYFAPFHSNADSYVALAADEYGTLIEVYPLGTEMLPGKDNEPIQYQRNENFSPFIATHAAISVPKTQEEIENIANREGWRVLRCNRGGFFDVIEFWVENNILLELATPELAQQYQAALAPDKLAELFAAQN
uniref:VOC domain-containing protein n=2 Tax=Gloeothece TaxID=28070 RepID=E0U601_GLOV7|nr:conserved hypothetical protein [Gloeothece verrucosa PCC 7822]